MSSRRAESAEQQKKRLAKRADKQRADRNSADDAADEMVKRSIERHGP